MTQKQTASVVVVLAIAAVLGVAVYMQFTKETKPETAIDTNSRQSLNQTEKAVVKQPIPGDIDGVTASISAESTLDTSALDDEVNGEAGELDQDNESINNLENSYDENNI